MPVGDSQTAIVVAVPEADLAVGRWRQLYDSSARLGVPAHITILYPFLDAGLIDESVTDDLREVFAVQPPFDFDFRHCGRFPGVLYLAPEPSEAFHGLTAAVAQRWPQTPPYGGAHDSIVPHLTVAHGVDAQTLELLESDLKPQLPLRAHAKEARLLVFDGSRWLARARFAFGHR